MIRAEAAPVCAGGHFFGSVVSPPRASLAASRAPPCAESRAHLLLTLRAQSRARVSLALHQTPSTDVTYTSLRRKRQQPGRAAPSASGSSSTNRVGGREYATYVCTCMCIYLSMCACMHECMTVCMQQQEYVHDIWGFYFVGGIYDNYY